MTDLCYNLFLFLVYSLISFDFFSYYIILQILNKITQYVNYLYNLKFCALFYLVYILFGRKNIPFLRKMSRLFIIFKKIRLG